MKTIFLNENELIDLFASWCEAFDVYTPSRRGGDAKSAFIGWEQVASKQACEGLLPNKIAKGVHKTSVKTFFFPQPETLVTFTVDNKPCAVEANENNKKRLVLGVRPCDARSVVLNAMPYKDDPYYRANQEKTVLVGFGCHEKAQTCFCERTGGSPLGSDGLDVLVTASGEGFVVEAVTKQGEELVGDSGKVDEALQAELAKKRENYIAEAAKADVSGVLREKALISLYQDKIWQELSQSCINCGACTFLCPTCYCFDIQDEVLRAKDKNKSACACSSGSCACDNPSVRRIRYWDSCMFPLFTKHASGHNPRGTKEHRVRNRFMHKLKYFPDRFGPLSCVGCGRCVRECPVNIDIREVMTALLAAD